jgi:hypothetical protein
MSRPFDAAKPRGIPPSAHRGSAVDDEDLPRQCFHAVGGEEGDGVGAVFGDQARFIACVATTASI